jgi:hypothetical protein
MATCKNTDAFWFGVYGAGLVFVILILFSIIFWRFDLWDWSAMRLLLVAFIVSAGLTKVFLRSSD